LPRSNSSWLKDYYNRITGELKAALQRKDTFTNWSLTILLAIIAVYFDLMTKGVPSFYRVSLLYVGGCLFTRFFVHSCLAYGYIRKWNCLVGKIEQFWYSNGKKPSYNELKKEIIRYDHYSKIPVKRRKLITAQLKAGFGVIASILLLLIWIECNYYSFFEWEYSLMITGISVAYLIYEGVMFIKYDRIKMPKLAS